jgi:hypothetical protein
MAAPRILRFILLFLTLSFDECIKIDEIRASVTDEEQKPGSRLKLYGTLQYLKFSEN